MGLIDAIVGTAATGYVSFRLFNKILERAFFQGGQARKALSLRS